MAERAPSGGASARRVALPAALGAVALALAWACAPGLEAPERFGYLQDAGSDAGAVDAGSDGGVDAGPLYDCAQGGPDAGCQVLRTFYCSCATTACHSVTEAAQSLDLESRGMPDRLINQQAQRGSWVMIDPANPDNSLLYLKLLAKPPYAARMPNGADPLPDAELACVKKWIHDAVGAP